MPITPIQIRTWLNLLVDFIGFAKTFKNTNYKNKQIRAVLKRLDQNKKQTLGELHVFKGIKEIFSCKTLELAWNSNKVNISCISKGIHTVRMTYSPAENRLRHEIIVTGRSGIRFDTANFFYELRGCIALGKEHTDIDGDGLRDVTDSAKTIKKFEKTMPEMFYIEII